MWRNRFVSIDLSFPSTRSTPFCRSSGKLSDDDWRSRSGRKPIVRDETWQAETIHNESGFQITDGSFRSPLGRASLLSIPLPLLSSEEEVFRRGILFLLPLVDPQLYFSQIGGRSLSLVDPDRIKVIGVGLCELAMVLGSGRALLFLLARCPRRNRRLSPISSSERLFSFLLGTAAISFYLFWAGFFGIINRSLLIPLVFAALGRDDSFNMGFHKADSHLAEPDSSFQKRYPFPPRPFWASSFSFWSCSTFWRERFPYEYDMLEYHARGPRESLKREESPFSSTTSI